MSKQSTESAIKQSDALRPQARSADAIRLGFLVWDVSRLWRVVLDRALKPLGVTRSQYCVIAFLARRDGMTQTALAADLDLTKVAVGGLLERMEAVGLVKRRADETDARVRRVYLTRKGTRMTQRIRELADPIEQQVLAPLADAELGAAIQSLAAIKGMLLELGEAGNGAEPD